MKAKIMIEGKEFEVELSKEQVQDLTETKKKTGYERVRQGEIYYIGTIDGTSNRNQEDNDEFDDCRYEGANYYSDVTITKNNARADKLYRQLRRFAVEHREFDNNWDGCRDYYFISFDTDKSEIIIDCNDTYKGFSIIYFDSEESAKLAIDTFKDELIWYFTEYKDSL